MLLNISHSLAKKLPTLAREFKDSTRYTGGSIHLHPLRFSGRSVAKLWAYGSRISSAVEHVSTRLVVALEPSLDHDTNYMFLGASPRLAKRPKVLLKLLLILATVMTPGYKITPRDTELLDAFKVELHRRGKCVD